MLYRETLVFAQVETEVGGVTELQVAGRGRVRCAREYAGIVRKGLTTSRSGTDIIRCYNERGS